MKNQAIKLVVITLLLSSVLTFTSLAGWTQTDAGWRYKEDAKNTYLSKCWIESETEKGLWYYLDENGLMATDKLIDDLYYVNELGEWREGSSSQKVSTPTNNQTNNKNIDKSKLGHDLDNWEYSGGSVEDILGEETANSLAEAINNAR